MTDRTARDICEGALKLIGKASQGQAVPAETLDDTYEFFTDMLDQWSIQGTKLYEVTELTHALTAGVGTYTLGPAGDIVQDPAPYEIYEAAIRDSADIESYVNIIGAKAYRRLQLKAVAMNRPERLWYQKDKTQGTVKLSPLPGTGLTLVMDVLLPLTVPALSTDTVFPDAYNLAMKMSLAEIVAPIFGAEGRITPRFQKQALDARTTVNARTSKRPVLKLDNGLRNRRPYSVEVW